MAIVTQFLRKLLCCFLLCFIFCGVFPGFAFADDGIFHSFPGVTIFSGSNSTHIVSQGIGSLDNEFESVFPGLYSLIFRSSFPKEFDSLKFDNISVNISHSGLELSDLSFSYPFNYQVAIFENYDNYVYSALPLSCYFEGSASVIFSDGSTSTYPLFSYNSISFSAKKVNSSNQFLISSEDFNISANPEDKDSGLTFKSRSDDNSSNLPHDEIYLGQLDIRSPRFLDMRSNATIIGGGSSDRIYLPTGVINATANLTTGVVSGSVSGRVNGLSLYGASFSSGSGSWSHIYIDEMDSTLAGVSVKNAEFDIAGKAVIDNAPVTIIPASEDVYITGFTVTGTISFKIVDYSSVSFDSSLPIISCLLFLYNPVYTFGASENLLSHITGTVDDIYFTLRYSLPLQIRHLLIPTQEEVKDVVDDAVDEIKNNAGGLGEAMDIVDTSFDTVTDAFTNSSASGFVLPALDVNINGTVYRIWEDYDFGPALRSQPVQQLTTFATTFLQALMVLYLINHLHVMWIALTSGCSYAGMLKLLKFEDDLERKG